MKNSNNSHVFGSMGYKNYLSTLKFVDLNIGNSSSGLLEVPSFRKFTINVGERQKDRLKALSVIDVKPKSKSKVKANVPEHGEPLWQALRALRKKLADEHGIPPFTVFHDSALIDMITTKPGNREQLLAISGVGVSKLDKYGDQFLAVLSEFDA